MAAYLRPGAGGVTGGVTGDAVGSTLIGSVVDLAGIVLPTAFDDSFI
jgi:hypothetical protein